MKKIIKKFHSVYKNIVPDSNVKRIINHNRAVWSSWNIDQSKSMILVDQFEFPLSSISFSYFANILAKKYHAKLVSFSMPRKYPHRVWKKIYESFNVNDNLVVQLDCLQKKRQQEELLKIMPNIADKRALFELKVMGYDIGIDIYENYIRMGNGTVDISDAILVELVNQAIGLVIFWEDFLRNNDVKAIVISHFVYLQYNVLNKIAYAKNIPVYIPHAEEMMYQVEPFKWYKYLQNYKNMFNQLPDEMKRSGIEIAKKQLNSRFSGEISVDMWYCRTTSFAPPNAAFQVLRPTNNIKIVICCHDFFDSPQCYGGMLFRDFYEWMEYLGEISKITDYDWYIKKHPNALPGNEKIIQSFVDKYSGFTILPMDTSHHQLVQEGIDFVLTVYGTVGIEYPLMGTQVINAGYNPHMAYDFNWHPRNLDEYRGWLLNLDKLSKKSNSDEVYECYYMNNYFMKPSDIIFRSYKDFVANMTKEQRAGTEVYDYFLNEYDESLHMEIILRMENFIESGMYYYFDEKYAVISKDFIENMLRQ